MFWKYYWKALAAVGLFIVCLIGFAWATTSDTSLWKEVKGQIFAEEMQIQKQLEDQVATLTKEKEGLTENIDQLIQERNTLLQKYTVLEGKKNDLERRLASIVVPDNPDDLVSEFRKLGLRSAKRR